MTRRTNARIAGFTFLFYIVVGITGLILVGGATGAEGMAAKLAAIAQHAAQVRVAFVLNLVTCFAALTLAVTLYAITRDQDRDLAMLAMTCRVAEGIVGGLFISLELAQLWLATSPEAAASGFESVNTLGAFLFKVGAWNPAAMFFAVGSTLFSWLMLRGRMIPVPLAWLGVFASVLLVVALPIQLAGVLPGSLSFPIWLPMLAFEVPLGFWLLIKGAAMPTQ